MIISKCINYCIILESTNSTKKNRQEEFCLSIKDDVTPQTGMYFIVELSPYTFLYHIIFFIGMSSLQLGQPDTTVTLKGEEYVL